MTFQRRIFALFPFVFAALLPTARADDLTVGLYQTVTISSEEKTLTTGKYDNQGTLCIESNGILNLGSGVTNPTPIEGALDLGVVRSAGEINSEQTIQFQKGSALDASGTIVSSKNVVFNGNATILGSIEAKVLVLNDLPKTADGDTVKPNIIDFGAGAVLNIDELAVLGSAELKSKAGETLTLDFDVNLSAAAAVVSVSEDLVIKGNYTAVAGSTLKSDKTDWTVTFMGGGEAVNGVNNLIGQSIISASLVRFGGATYLAENLIVQGDLELLDDSTTSANRGLVTGGKLTIDGGATLRLAGSSYENMGQFGTGYYNGIFAGGFDLKDGATLTTMNSGDYLQIAFADESTMEENSKIAAKFIFLNGTNNSGTYTVQSLLSRGTIEAEAIELAAAKVELTGTGTMKVDSLKLTYKSQLTLISGGDRLIFSEGKGTVSIGGDSLISAAGQYIDFKGAAVVNLNSSGGITATQIRFGDKGSYTSPGKTNANAVFGKGSTLILTSDGHTNFVDNNVLFETGSTIQMNIKDSLVGSLLTTGKVEMQEGVYLAVADGSNFEGRTQQYLVARGGSESEYTKLEFEKSLFFELSDSWAIEMEDDSKNQYLGLVVEIVKVADLVDYAGSANQLGLGKMIDHMIADKTVSGGRATVYDALMRMSSDKAYRQALDTLSGSIRENAVAFVAESPWRRAMDDLAFHRLSLAFEKKKTAAMFGEPTTVGQSKSIMPSLPMSRSGLSSDLWFNSYYHYGKLDSDNNTIGGDGNLGGFALGAGLPTMSKEALIGLSFAYGSGRYDQDGGKVDIDDFQLGVYGGVNLFARNLQLRGYFGYGIQDYASKRTVQFGSLTPRSVWGDTHGDSISAAVLLIRPVDMSPYWILKPTLGVDFQRLSQNGYTERGASEVAWAYDDLTLTRTMLRFGASSNYAMRRAELTGRLFYGVKVAGDNAATSWHYVPGQPGYGFEVSGVGIGTGVVDLGFGGNFGLNAARTALVFLDYGGAFSSHGNSHTGSLGFLWKR